MPKHERLSSKKNIAALFKKGKAYTHYPIRLICLPMEGLEHHQVLFTVPRRHFKKAVDRNLLKRRIREAYRQHKHIIPYKSSEEVHFLLGYVYIAREKCTYPSIETKIVASLYRLKK